MVPPDASPQPFQLRPAAAGVPVLVSVCHAGRAYTPDLLARARVPARVLAELEDPLVDELAADLRRLGAGLLVAAAPRALVDLNRAPDDIEPAAVQGPVPLFPTGRARIGLGVVPTRLAGAGSLWRRPLTAGEWSLRLRGVHEPFHRTAADELARIRAQCGAALLLDLHSMPPLADGTDVVIGDRHGTSCAPGLTAIAADTATRHGLSVRANDPYAGGHVVTRHGRPGANVHALQVELARDLYLDATGRRPGPGWGAAEAFLADLVTELGEELHPQAWPQAAE